MDKRKFLKVSTSLVAGSLIPRVAGAGGYSESPATLSGKINPIVRSLGKTGIELPIISSGIIPQNLPPLIRKLFESGIRHFDSAWDYQNGRNDLMLRDMLCEFGRENFIISTKVLLPFDEITGQYKQEATKSAFMEQLEVTMKRLDVNYVDMLYLHKPPTRAAALNNEILAGLEKARQQGKARFLGISCHSNQVELINTAIESKLYEVMLVGYNFRQDHIVKPALKKANEAGLGIVAMKVFAGEYQDKERNKLINKTAALKWVLQDENVHTAILTFRTYEDYNMFMPMMHNIEMSSQERQDLAEAYQSPGLYCLGCECCRKQCRNCLPIPDLMRAYMYAYGYKDAAEGQKVIRKLRIQDQPCTGCEVCEVKCTQGFNIPEKITDIIRLKNIPGEFLS